MCQQTEVRLITPQPGDIYVSCSNSYVFLGEVTGENARTVTIHNREITLYRVDYFVESGTHRRQRYLRNKRQAGEAQYQDARDFTARKLWEKFVGTWIVGKYFPELVGRRLFIQGSTLPRYVGRITDQQPAAKKQSWAVLPREQMEFVPGAILYASWGYEQTNIDFFEIVKRQNAWVWVQEIGQTDMPQDNDPWMTGHCIPNPELRKGEVLKRKVRVHNGKECSITIDDCRTASLWDGRELNWTSYH